MAYLKEAEGFLAKLPSISLEGMDPLGSQGPSKEQGLTAETQGYKVQPGYFAFPGFEHQAAAEQKNSMLPSNSTYSPNSTLFPLSSIESYESGSARTRSQAGLNSNPMAGMSSCESDTAEDPSLRRSLRGGRKSMPAKEKRKVGRPIAYCGDPNSPDLTPAERRRIKRRIANRESARRVRARRQDMIEEMAIKARQMEDQNMQLANHASAVEQQHAAMMAQLGEFNQRLQQTTVENEQLAKQISCLRNAVNNTSMAPAQQAKEVGDHVQPSMPMSVSPVNHSSSSAMGFGSSALPMASMPINTQGLQTAPSFGNGLRSAFMQSASTALLDVPDASGPLFGIPRGFSKGFSLAPSMDQLMPNMDPLGMSLNDFLLGEAC